ncbi:hypothetical protein [Pseudoalteromonas sp. Angola-7]|nr:hypothetical protein [Pseudoalteromonas sp. Angola-7]MDC9530526.1 hypothetical protein [Pseudoalteromonas sp. Angola-7]
MTLVFSTTVSTINPVFDLVFITKSMDCIVYQDSPSSTNTGI